MQPEKPITVKRDCDVLMVPSGEKLKLVSGSTVWLTQSLGGSYTVMTDRGYTVRVEGKDADAIGLEPVLDGQSCPDYLTNDIEAVESRVWEQLRSCFDPEIPVNIVELGLIYDCAVTPIEGAYRVSVKFTLTARGCGMGEVLKRDIATKLLAIPGVREADVELVWDPPWSQSRISAAAKLQLGMA